jgi:hypothetical protein
MKQIFNYIIEYGMRVWGIWKSRTDINSVNLNERDYFGNMCVNYEIKLIL